ncbi:hypothetical protein GCK72_021116 [Caenorhabditis remanei]|uniref:F-box domain-containing protein n=1 Tax=Caenorhabditis remanei TaxID=31234 RepID=A0A6A5GIP7_CAERE|nr:hypothetical protein GCK72_021116 [Caenorhabditis remanei]KAF1754553.1 hypothetical protein GCK72_021116 [Caenorhabditis remanei]
MTTPFPLLRLPRLALFPVFEQMEEREIITFSLLSKRAHSLSKSLRKLSARFIELTVEKDRHYLTARFKYRESVGPPFHTILTKHLVFQNETVSHEKIGLSEFQWIERVLDVTNSESLQRVDINGVPRLDMCDALSSLKNIRELFIGVCCPDSFAKKTLEILSPVTTEITIWKTPFENRDEFQTFLKSNLNFLNIHYHYVSRNTLDDLLVTNALKLKLGTAMLGVTGIKRFLTKWFHSKRNSRLEHLSFCTLEGVNEMCLPKVLKAVPFPRDQERTFFYSKELDTVSESFRGGYDIERTDGKKATIIFVPGHRLTCIDFYVWPCI